jgi:cytochrome c oxidase subunit II
MMQEPRDISNFVAGFESTFMLIFWVAVFFITGITLTMLYFIYRYNRKKNPVATQIKGSVPLELLWTAIPVALVLVMFQYGWTGWKPMLDPPDDAMVVKSYARMWSWLFEYENGMLTDTLFVPQNRPVRVDLIAQDVLHSLYIPAFRIKQDMVPGKEGFMWFEAGVPGTYDLFCAEYCGLQHAYMTTAVVVMPEYDFDEWLADTTRIAEIVADDPVSAGRQIVRLNGCTACHSADGTTLVGPTFRGLYGSEVTVITAGTQRQVVADDEYIRRSIYEPDADITVGYPPGLMQSYRNLIDEQGIQDIIEYLKTLQ